MNAQQINKTNRKINLNTIITGMLIPIGVGIFWKCVQIYNLILLQHSIDAAQNVQITQTQIAITSLMQLSDEAKNKNNEQDIKLVKLDAALPKRLKL